MDLIIKECSFPEVVKDLLEIPAYTKAQMPEDKDINSVIDWLVKKQLIKKSYTPQDLSNSSFIQ
jgi:NitT/TauT family transport system substrate-binding protein